MNERFSSFAGLRAAVVRAPLWPKAAPDFRRRENDRQEHNAAARLLKAERRVTQRRNTAKRKKAETPEGWQDAKHAAPRDRR
jgi:hypothetical protein